MATYSWKHRRCALVVALSSLTAVTTLIIIRHRLSDHMSHTTPRSKPTSTEAPSTTTLFQPSPSKPTTTEKPSTTTPVQPAPRTVQLDIGDVADLLRRLQSATDDVVRRVSSQMNQALRAFQQGRCRTPEVDFTDTGAWCERAVASLHIVDRHLAQTLAQLLAGATVLSLGDGTGVYRELILNTSLVCHFLYDD